MKSKKTAVLFVVVLSVSTPAGAWGFLVPYADAALRTLAPAWNLLYNIGYELLVAIATNPKDHPLHP